jgi:hypothetical protein
MRYNRVMLIGSLLAWWYGVGLKKRLDDLGAGILRVVDLFSVGLLLRTLFSPFKLISAGVAPTAPVDVRFRMWADRLFSRCFGAVVRTVVIAIGLIVIILRIIFSFLVICFHLAVPVLPIIGLVMFAMGMELPWSL